MNPLNAPAIVQPAANPAAELRAAFTLFEESGRKRLEAAVVIGGILAAQKKACGHGNWLPWLAEHFPYERNRAAEFIRVYENRGKCIRADTFEDAIRLIAAVPDEPEEPAAEPPPDDELEPVDEHEDDTPLEETEPEPQPAAPAAPEHPFAALMSAVTSLTTNLTRAVNAGDARAERLKHVLTTCALLDYPAEMGGNPRFLPLAGVRALLDMAGAGGKLPKDETIKVAYAKANGTWVPPLVLLRRDAKAKKN